MSRAGCPCRFRVCWQQKGGIDGSNIQGVRPMRRQGKRSTAGQLVTHVPLAPSLGTSGEACRPVSRALFLPGSMLGTNWRRAWLLCARDQFLRMRQPHLWPGTRRPNNASELRTPRGARSVDREYCASIHPCPCGEGGAGPGSGQRSSSYPLGVLGS
jgi:hypothetical protein